MRLAILLLFASISGAAEYPYMLSAPWTPFTRESEVNLTAVEPQMELAKRKGVTHVWVTGMMSQYDQLTLNERLSLAKEYISACKKFELYSIIHVGSQCIRDAMYLATEVSKLGPDSIAVIPPIAPERPTTIEDLVAVLQTVAMKAPDLPFFYYHIPGATHADFQMAELIPMAASVIPNFAGVKFVSSDLEDFRACTQLACEGNGCDKDGSYTLFWAPEPKAQALPYGARAFTLAEAWAAPYTKPVYEAWPNENATWAAQNRLDSLRHLVNSVPGAGRYLTTMLGVYIGDPRMPQHGISQEDYDLLEGKLREWGFFK